MRKVILIGKIDNNKGLKISQNDIEIVEYTIDDIKVKSFGKLAIKASNITGLVVADGTIDIREYTNKDGKTYNIQDILINKIEQLEDNFDVKPSDFAPGKSKIESPKQMTFDDEELPF